MSGYFNIYMKLVLILILCIFIVLLGIILTNNKHEGFTSKNNKNKQIKFLNTDEACKMIKDIDYFHNLTQADLTARKFIKDSTNVTESYCNNYLYFNNEEKEKLTKTIQSLPDNELFSKWSFAKMSTSVEDGFPHTHKDTIFLSEYTINEKPDRLLFVLVHEQMHVMQRKKPELFDKLYTKYYPFKKGKLGLSDKVVKKMRSNPDTRFTPESDYMYIDGDDRLYYLCAVYSQEIPTSLGDVKYIAVNLDHDKEKEIYKGSEDIMDISGMSNFNNFFSIDSNHYHPNEISAEIIGLYYSDKQNRIYSHHDILQKIDSPTIIGEFIYNKDNNNSKQIKLY